MKKGVTCTEKDESAKSVIQNWFTCSLQSSKNILILVNFPKNYYYLLALMVQYSTQAKYLLYTESKENVFWFNTQDTKATAKSARTYFIGPSFINSIMLLLIELVR